MEEITKKNEIVIVNGQLAEQTINYIREMEIRKKRQAEEYDQFKAELLQAMEQNNIIKINAGGVKISYVAGGEQENFDKKQFREDMPELYDEYVKYSPVKASVRIKVD